MGSSNQKKKVIGALSLVTSTVFLGGCGLGSEAEEQGREIGSAIACALVNCTNSDTMIVSDITASYFVTQKSGQVSISAFFGQTANVLTTVAITGGDALSAAVDNQPVTFQATPTFGSPYTARVADASLQPVASINFVRGVTSYTSTVTLPPSFSMLSPTRVVNVGKSTGNLVVQLSLPTTTNVQGTINGSCNRADGSNFVISNPIPVSVTPVPNTNNNFAMATADIDSQVNYVGQTANAQGVSNKSPVTTCALQVDWQTQVSGVVSPSFYKASRILGIQSVENQVNYDARI